MLHSSCYLGGHSHGVWLAYPCSYAQYESPSPVGEGVRGGAGWCVLGGVREDHLS